MTDETISRPIRHVIAGLDLVKPAHDGWAISQINPDRNESGNSAAHQDTIPRSRNASRPSWQLTLD
jgi:hypothetical protein